jgi:NADPH2:quinone reductase
MRAVLVERPGGIDRLKLAEQPAPQPGPGEILIRVAYAAANWGDIQKRQGIYPDPVAYPAVLGAEVSGRVAALGRGVRGLREGQRVAAICGPRMLGGYAELVAVPAEYAMEAPAGLGLAEAAALPVAMLTAWHLLHTAHQLRRGEVLLVHAIAGAVGLALTQVAKLAGATVIGTVGGAGKAELPLRFGAARIIDRGREDFVRAALDFTDGRGVDLVIDSLGGGILPRSFDALRRYGRLINIGEAAGEPDFPVRKKLYERSTSMAGFEVLHAEPGSPRWRRGVRYVAEQAAAGRLIMPVVEVFPLAEAACMHARFESRGVSGKLLLEVDGQGGGE